MFTKLREKFAHRDYSFTVLDGGTSQAAIKHVKKASLAQSVRKFTVLSLVAIAFISGVGALTTSTAVTSKHANANLIADMMCVVKSKDNGKWSSGANIFFPIGGSTVSMSSISREVPQTDSAWAGKPTANMHKTPQTALEKYGFYNPKFEAWKPAFSEEKPFKFHNPTDAVNQFNNDHPFSGAKPVGEIKIGEGELTTTGVLSCLNLMGHVNAAVGNMMSSLPRVGLDIATRAYGVAANQDVGGSINSSNMNVMSLLGKIADQIVTGPNGLRQALFVPFLIPLLLIGAVFVAYAGIFKKQFTIAFGQIVWMVIAVALGTAFLAKPSTVPYFFNQAASAVAGVTNDAIMSGATNAEPMCNIGGGSGGGTGKRTFRAETIRSQQCYIWYSTVYTSWKNGQFGTNANDKSTSSVLKQDPLGVLNNTRIHMGKGHSFKPSDWGAYQADRQVISKRFETANVAYAQLSGKNAVNNDWRNASQAVTSTIFLAVGAIAVSGVLLVFGLALIFYQLMLLITIIVAPFFFLAAVVPNWGKRILLRYAELLAGLMVKQIITFTMLAVYLRFYVEIVKQTSLAGIIPAAMLVQIIFIVALSIFALVARGKLIRAFADKVDFGGNKSVGLPGAKLLSGGAAAGTGLALGAAVAGPLGAAVGASVGGLKGRGNAKRDKGMTGDGTSAFKPGSSGSPAMPTQQFQKGNDRGALSKQAERVGQSAVDEKIKNKLAEKSEDKKKAGNNVQPNGKANAKTGEAATPNGKGNNASTDNKVNPSNPTSTQGKGTGTKVGPKGTAEANKAQAPNSATTTPEVGKSNAAGKTATPNGTPTAKAVPNGGSTPATPTPGGGIPTPTTPTAPPAKPTGAATPNAGAKPQIPATPAGAGVSTGGGAATTAGTSGGSMAAGAGTAGAGTAAAGGGMAAGAGVAGGAAGAGAAGGAAAGAGAGAAAGPIGMAAGAAAGIAAGKAKEMKDQHEANEDEKWRKDGNIV